jgi:type II secretion system protein G
MRAVRADVHPTIPVEGIHEADVPQGRTKSLERMRAGHASCRFGDAGPPASLSCIVEPREHAMRMLPFFVVLVACAISCERRHPHDWDHRGNAYTQIAAFAIGLDAFARDCGRYPTTAEGLLALVKRPADIPEARWHGPYFESIPQDPWGHDYVYCCPGVRNSNRFDLYSCGPDGMRQAQRGLLR